MNDCSETKKKTNSINPNRLRELLQRSDGVPFRDKIRPRIYLSHLGGFKKLHKKEKRVGASLSHFALGKVRVASVRAEQAVVCRFCAGRSEAERGTHPMIMTMP